ncbi:hypothetical protein OHA25_37370 [Nonomuraea sp. NBC_00507]|uniref:hypothetical protein n=1 Tax=Nonomuraea sp. NBC_00507 TaxID=2976002 RepID=UPI002E17E2C2
MFMREARFPRREHPVDIEVAVRITSLLLGFRGLSFGDVGDVVREAPGSGVLVLPEVAARFALTVELMAVQALGGCAVDRAVSVFGEGEAGPETFGAECSLEPCLDADGIETAPAGASECVAERGECHGVAIA